MLSCNERNHVVQIQQKNSPLYHRCFKAPLIALCVIGLFACDSKQKPLTEEPKLEQQKNLNPDILPFLNIQEVPAKYALPFCEKNDCINLDIQTINTQNDWLNRWIEQSQAKVIQDQIGLNQIMSLQQAVNAYVKKSDAWQAEFKKNEAYELSMDTRIASQRNQYVLLQVIVHTKQQGVTVKDRGYFFVADRKNKKELNLLDLIQKNQQNVLNQIVQEKYKAWLGDQAIDVKKTAPKKLYWGQSDWFFDDEGVGLHYRANEIIKDGSQLDIYLSKQQTQQVLAPKVFEKMF